MTLNIIPLKILQILFYLFPITFIFGNLLTNIFILLISLLGIIFYKSKIFQNNDKFITLLFILFFLLIFSSSYINHYILKENPDVLKSIFYLRYFIFLIVVRTVILYGHINLSKFFIFILFIVFFIAIDILIQFIFGKNIVGFEPIFLKAEFYTGFFKEELIAGGYIMMSSTLSFFSIPLLFKNQSKIILLIIFTCLAFIIFGSLFLAGNRMPTVLFAIFLITAAVLYKKKGKKLYIIFTTIISIALICLVALKFDPIKKRYISFQGGLPNPFLIFQEINKDYPELEKYKNTGVQFYAIEEIKKDYPKNLPPEYNILPFVTGHRILFITSIDLFLEKPFIGRGIKSFRNYCEEKIHLPNRVCESHPHNFFLDLLNDVGILGLLIILIPIVKLFYSNYSEYLSQNKKQFSDWIYFTICLVIFIHFFPIKSSGSFFSTYNSAFTFLILGISLGIHETKNSQILSKEIINS